MGPIPVYDESFCYGTQWVSLIGVSAGCKLPHFADPKCPGSPVAAGRFPSDSTNLTLLQVNQDALLETRERVERAGSTAAKA
jgi:hypothetical protein